MSVEFKVEEIVSPAAIAAELRSEHRTNEKFARKFADVKWYVGFHNKPVWLIPGKSDYFLSIIAPKPDELPGGTKAWLIGPNPENPDEPTWIKSVKSEKEF
jgi:hypothetical protein